MSVVDQLNAMIAGTHENTEVEEIEETEVEQDEGVNDEVVEETTNEVDAEDTDQEDETEEEEDTEETDDDSEQETSETEDDTQEEDTHAEPENTEVATESTTDAVDYKKFYEEVALAKFTANGREVEGFKNPEDLIRAQQMLHGYSDKMKVFKEYKKFLKPLEERKITQDPERFNLAMSLLDGDIEAIKKVIKDKGIDPLEMDLDDIKYVNRNTLPSDAQLLIEEVSAQARDLGVEDKFHRVLTKDFDDESIEAFVNIKNGHIRNNLIRQIKNGTYYEVRDEVNRMELLDSNNDLSGLNSIEKYNLAANRLYLRNNPAPKEVQQAAQVDAAQAKQKLELDKINAERARAEAEEFKKKAAEKERLAAEARNKAASVSKKRVVKEKAESVKPESLKGDDFKNYFRDMMMS
jgi:hypothetical protein